MLLSQTKKLLSPAVLQISPFIAEGFGSWNKALERFDMHEKSQMHCEAVQRLACKISNVDIFCYDVYVTTMYVYSYSYVHGYCTVYWSILTSGGSRRVSVVTTETPF